MEYHLHPAPEWGFDASRAHRGDFDTHEQRVAFLHVYETRQAALEAAAMGGLFPTVENYGPGITTIRVMPEGCQPPYTIRQRHHGGGRSSGRYC